MNERTACRLLVGFAALTAFAPCLVAEFAGWDDPVFIVDNPLIRGLSVAHLRGMWESTLGGVRMPLTWLSLAVDHALWGLQPGGFHLTNLLLHVLTALLFHEICRVLFRRLDFKEAERGAALAALLWAVHPLRVETVAWAYERKGVLSGALWAAALLARLRSHESARSGRWEAAAVGAYALSLLAKPNGLTFPLVLLVVERALLGLRPAWARYLPYLALSALAFLATLLAGAAASAVSASALTGLPWKLGQALYGFWFYLLQTISPRKLSVYYAPRPWFPDWSWVHAALAGALAASVVGLRYAGARARPFAAALACYALALLPMLGLVQHGVPHAAADRFSYLPGMALAAPLGAWLAAAGRRGVWAGLCLALGLGVGSWRRSGDWATPLTLWSSAVRQRPSANALTNEGTLLAGEGRHAQAVEKLRASLARARHDSAPYEALGSALAALGRDAEAEAAWREGLSHAPSAELSARLGDHLTRRGRRLEGTALLQQAVAERPEKAAWLADLGDALATEKPGDARAAYERALQREPSLGRALNNLGMLTQDRALFVRALRTESRSQAQHNLGLLALRAGNIAEAHRRFREAARLDPSFGAPRVNLGNLLARSGRLREAAEQYRAVKKEDRASYEARSNLAAIEAALRRR